MTCIYSLGARIMFNCEEPLINQHITILGHMNLVEKTTWLWLERSVTLPYLVCIWPIGRPVFSHVCARLLRESGLIINSNKVLWEKLHFSYIIYTFSVIKYNRGPVFKLTLTYNISFMAIKFWSLENISKKIQHSYFCDTNFS